MDFASHPGVDWKALFRLTGFRYYFAGMFISLFGTGMNFAGVTWYILAETNSTVKVSLITILVTLPGLVVPPFGGVLIDRVDRRWLGIGLDLGRAGNARARAGARALDGPVRRHKGRVALPAHAAARARDRLDLCVHDGRGA